MKTDKAKRTASASSSLIDDDMEDDKGSPLVCKNPTSEDISLSDLKKAVKSSPSKSKKSTTVTPQELHAQIQKSRDKLFFIAYAPPDETKSSPTKWFLVRVDLETCDELDETQNCKTTGQYYVEFYSKALDDRSKSDNVSKWWLIWNTFSYKRGNMIIGGATEFNPNKKTSVKKRLVDLFKNGNSAKVRPQFQANLERYTTYSDIVNLADDTIRLVGPFDFKAVDLNHIDPEMRVDIGRVSPDDVYVRDLVPTAQWMELTKALKGRKMTPPTIENENKKRKRQSTTNNEKKRAKTKDTCELCGEDDSSQEFLVFQGTSSLPARHVHKDCKSQLQSPSINATASARIKEVSNLFQKTLESIRQAKSSNGEAYCMIDELKAEFITRLDSLVKPKSAEATMKVPNTPVLVDGYPESEFAPEDVKHNIYAYCMKEDDPTGLTETNAKIAKLDHDVKKRRERRLAREYADDSKKTYSSRTAPSKSRSVKVQPELVPSIKSELVTSQTPFVPLIQPEQVYSQTPDSNDQVSLQLSGSSQHIKDDHLPDAIDQQSSSECKQATGVLARVQAMKSKEKANTKIKSRGSRSGCIYNGPHLSFPAEPAAPHLNIPNLPNGWILRKVPRSDESNSNKSSDRYYFSPGGRRFRSKPEVERFLRCLSAAGGNEDEAAILFVNELKSAEKGRKPDKTKEAEATIGEVPDRAEMVVMDPEGNDSTVDNGMDEAGGVGARCDYV